MKRIVVMVQAWLAIGMVLMTAEAWGQIPCVFLSDMIPPVAETPVPRFRKVIKFTFVAQLGFPGSPPCTGIVKDTVSFSFAGGGQGVTGLGFKPQQVTLNVGQSANVTFSVLVTKDAIPNDYPFQIKGTTILDGVDLTGADVRVTP